MSFNSQIKYSIDNFYTNPRKVGVLVTYTPVTRTLDGMSGDEILTEGTSENIYCNISTDFKKTNKYFLKKEGQVLSGDALIIVKSTQSLNKDDIITYTDDKGVTRKYRVRNIYRLVINNILIGIEGNLFLDDSNV